MKNFYILLALLFFGVEAGYGQLTTNVGGTSYTLPAATTASLGGVKPDGTTLTVTGTGVIAISAATQATINGAIQTGSFATVATDGTGIFEITQSSGLFLNQGTILTDAGDGPGNTIHLPNAGGTLLLSNGSGASLTSLNASNLSSGTVPAARLPSLTGSITSSGTSTTFTNGTTGTGSVVLSASPTLSGTLTIGSLLQIGTALGYADTGILGTAITGTNSYAQFILQNTSSGTLASADVVVNNNLSTATTYFGDFGINSSTFAGTGPLNAANATFVTATTGTLALGTTTANDVDIVVSGTLTALNVTATGTVNIPGAVVHYGPTTLNGTTTLGGTSTLNVSGTVNFTGTVNKINGTTIPTTSGDTAATLAGTQTWTGRQTFSANRYFSQLAADASVTGTVATATSLAVTLPPGTYRYVVQLTMSTTSTTSGLNAYMLTVNSGDFGLVALLNGSSNNAPTAYFNPSFYGVGATIANTFCNAPVSGCGGLNFGVLTVAGTTTTYTVYEKQYNAVDGSNPAKLLKGSYMLFETAN